jgi:predicted ATPase
LQLFTSCAEVQLALGNSSETISVATQVLSRGRSLQDKLGAYHALIKAKISQGDANEPVQIGLSVLDQLGESFPTNIDQALIGKELMETKHLLESSSMEKVLKTDTMTDADRVATMRFLLLVSRMFCCALECRLSDRLTVLPFSMC